MKRKLNNLNLQLFAVTAMPDNPFASAAAVGKDFLLYINTGSVDSPAWTQIGGQRSASLSMTASEIDVTDKSSGGWSAKLAGLKAWSYDLSGLLLLKNDGIEALRRVFLQSKQANIRFRYPDNSYQIGWASVTEFSAETPHDGEATLKGKLNGVGPISNVSIAVPKATAADQTFYFEGSASATKVIKGSAELTADDFDATVTGQVTLKAAYLGSLSAGEVLLYVSLDIGGYALVAITITE